MAHHRVHKFRAKNFYDFLKEEAPEIETFSFDCQKLPKVPNQSAYFSMQINFYEIAVIRVSSRAPLNARALSILTCVPDF